MLSVDWVDLMAETRSDEIKREVVTLREYLEHKIDAAVERLGDRITSGNALALEVRTLTKEAVDKYEAAQRQRDVVSNEFRASLEDQAKNQVTTVQFNSTVVDLRLSIQTLATTIVEKIDADRERISILEKANAASGGAAVQKNGAFDRSLQWVNAVIAIVGVVAGLIVAFVVERVSKP